MNATAAVNKLVKTAKDNICTVKLTISIPATIVYTIIITEKNILSMTFDLSSLSL